MSDSTQLSGFEKVAVAQEKATSMLASGVENWEKKTSEQSVERMVGELGKFSSLFVLGATKFIGFVSGAASAIEKEARAAKESNTSAGGYKAVEYAASQTGVDSGSVSQSLKNVAAFWKNDKAGEGMLNNMGVQTRMEDGNQADNVDVFTQIGHLLSAMEPEAAGQFSGALSIDEKTLNAMRQGMAQYIDDYRQLMNVTGYGAQQTAEQSAQFMNSWREMASVMDLLGSKAEGFLAEGLNGPLNTLTEKLLSKAPQIENALDKIVGFLIWFGEIFADTLSGIIDFVTDIVSWWDTLDSESQSLVATLSRVAGAWRVLNSAFLTSPIGIKSIAGIIKDVAKSLGGWEPVFNGIATYVAVTWVAQMVSAIGRVIKALLMLDNASAKSMPAKFFGKLGFAGAAAVALEPAIDKGLNWAFGNSDYYQRIRTAPTWKDFGKAIIGEGDAKWVGNKWVDNRGKNGDAQTDSWAQLSKAFPPSLDSLSHLAQPGIESIMLSGYGNNRDWRYASAAEVQPGSSAAISSPTWNNNTNIVINNATDPFTTGAEVEQRQLNIYARQAQLVSGGIT